MCKSIEKSQTGLITNLSRTLHKDLHMRSGTMAMINVKGMCERTGCVPAKRLSQIRTPESVNSRCLSCLLGPGRQVN